MNTAADTEEDTEDTAAGTQEDTKDTAAGTEEVITVATVADATMST